MANHTEHYGLHQWEPGDSFLRTDFNEDHAKLDAALAGLQSGKCEVTFGTYTGDGAAQRTIGLGFTPKAVLVESANGMRLVNAGMLGGLALPGKPVCSGIYTALSIDTGGFQVTYTQYQSNLNQKDAQFYYIAFR